MSLIQDMTPLEKDKVIHKMASDMSFIKRWYPVLIVIVGLLGFTIKGTLYVSQNVATQQDIAKIDTALNRLTVAVNQIKEKQDKNHIIATTLRDSTNKIVNTRLEELEIILEHKRKKEHTRYYVGVKRSGPGGPTTFEPRIN